MGMLRAVWLFCSYLFWPQWGKRGRKAEKRDYGYNGVKDYA